MKEKQQMAMQNKVKEKDKEQSSSESRPKKAQTLSDCLTRNITQWPTDSAEYLKRCDGVVNMLLETGWYGKYLLLWLSNV